MAQFRDEEPTSGFVRPDEILKSERFTDFSIVPSRGHSLLVRAKRNGRWWMLKGLKEQYRQDTAYQVILQKEYEITSQLQHPMVVENPERTDPSSQCFTDPWKFSYFDPLKVLAGGVIIKLVYLLLLPLIFRTLSPDNSI